MLIFKTATKVIHYMFTPPGLGDRAVELKRSVWGKNRRQSLEQRQTWKREKSTASTLPSNSTATSMRGTLAPSFLFCSTCNQPTNPTKPCAATDLVEGHGEGSGQCWHGSQTDSTAELASSGEGNGALLGTYYVPGSLPQFPCTARVPHKASIS